MSRNSATSLSSGVPHLFSTCWARAWGNPNGAWVGMGAEGITGAGPTGAAVMETTRAAETGGAGATAVGTYGGVSSPAVAAGVSKVGGAGGWLGAGAASPPGPAISWSSTGPSPSYPGSSITTSKAGRGGAALVEGSAAKVAREGSREVRVARDGTGEAGPGSGRKSSSPRNSTPWSWRAFSNC